MYRKTPICPRDPSDPRIHNHLIWLLIRSATWISTWGLKRFAVSMRSDLSTLMCLEYLSSFFPLAWYQILRFSTWICHAWQIHPAGNFTLLAGNVLELTHFPISCQLCGKLTSPPVMFKTRAEIQLVTNYFLREEFHVFTRCWNTSWGSCSKESPQLNPLMCRNTQ